MSLAKNNSSAIYVFQPALCFPVRFPQISGQRENSQFLVWLMLLVESVDFFVFETSCLYLSWRSKSAKTFETSDHVYVGHHAIVQLVSGCDPSLFVLFCTRPRTFLASESFLVYSLQKYAKRHPTSIMTTLLDLIKSVAQWYEKESIAKRNDSLMLKITFVLTLVWSTNKSSLSYQNKTIGIDW